MAADRTQRDDDGFLVSPSEEFSKARYAIVSESVDVDDEGPHWAAKDFLGTIRIRSESERPVFVVTEIGRKPRYSERLGAAPESPPGDQEFWAASTAGADERTLEWEPEDGHWSIVVMNTDGSRGVADELSIGAELDPLIWMGIGLLVIGGLLAILTAVAITAGSRRRG